MPYNQAITVWGMVEMYLLLWTDTWVAYHFLNFLNTSGGEIKIFQDN